MTHDPLGEVWGSCPIRTAHAGERPSAGTVSAAHVFDLEGGVAPSPSLDGLALSPSPDPHDASDTTGPQFPCDENNNRVLRLAIKINLTYKQARTMVGAEDGARHSGS